MGGGQVLQAVVFTEKRYSCSTQGVFMDPSPQKKIVMRLVLCILMTIVLSFMAEQVFAWWSLAVISFLSAALFNLTAARGFLAGFLSGLLLWLSVSLYADIANDHILSTRMAALFHLPGTTIFLVVAACVGALVGGLAGASGALVRKYFLPAR